MTDSRINLKSPLLAGILAFLLPGLGHLYQRRFVKSAIYAVCILGLYCSGMAMAGWKAVQAPDFGRGFNTSTLKYAAQAGVGLPSMYAVVQRQRYDHPENGTVDIIDSAMELPFTGHVDGTGMNEWNSVEAVGTISLEPVAGDFGSQTIGGVFRGTLDGKSEELVVLNVELGKPVSGLETRRCDGGVYQEIDGKLKRIAEIEGTVPRPFLDWFQAPMNEDQEQKLHKELGKYHELAMVMTWMAGLLNVLAIWDAVEGPAYGYNDEIPEGEATDEKAKATT